MVHLPHTQFILVPALHKLKSRQVQNLCIQLKMHRSGVVILTNSPARKDKTCRKIGAVLQIIGKDTRVIALREMSRPADAPNTPYAIYTDQKQQRHLIMDGAWIGHNPLSRLRTGIYIKALASLSAPEVRGILSVFRRVLPVKTLLRRLHKYEAFFSQELEAQIIEHALSARARHVVWVGYSSNKEKVIVTPHYIITFTAIRRRNQPQTPLVFSNERWHLSQIL